MYKFIRNAFGDKGAQNLPVGVQVFGRPFQEELVLHVMKEIEKLRDDQKMFKPLEF